MHQHRPRRIRQMLLAPFDRERDRRTVAAVGQKARLEFGQRRAGVHQRDRRGHLLQRHGVDSRQLASKISQQGRRRIGQYRRRRHLAPPAPHHIARAAPVARLPPPPPPPPLPPPPQGRHHPCPPPRPA